MEAHIVHGVTLVHVMVVGVVRRPVGDIVVHILHPRITAPQYGVSSVFCRPGSRQAGRGR